MLQRILTYWCSSEWTLVSLKAISVMMRNNPQWRTFWLVPHIVSGYPRFVRTGLRYHSQSQIWHQTNYANLYQSVYGFNLYEFVYIMPDNDNAFDYNQSPYNANARNTRNRSCLVFVTPLRAPPRTRLRKCGYKCTVFHPCSTSCTL